MTKRRWTVMFESEDDPGAVFSTFRVNFGELLAFDVRVVGGE